MSIIYFIMICIGTIGFAFILHKPKVYFKKSEVKTLKPKVYAVNNSIVQPAPSPLPRTVNIQYPTVKEYGVYLLNSGKYKRNKLNRKVRNR